jgi:hypothetical protein
LLISFLKLIIIKPLFLRYGMRREVSLNKEYFDGVYPEPVEGRKHTSKHLDQKTTTRLCLNFGNYFV